MPVPRTLSSVVERPVHIGKVVGPIPTGCTDRTGKGLPALGPAVAEPRLWRGVAGRQGRAIERTRRVESSGRNVVEFTRHYTYIIKMSEFRQDLVSGDWVIVAPERIKRPHDFLPKRQKRSVSPKATCPFEDLDKSGNKPILAAVPKWVENPDARKGRGSDRKRLSWRAVVVPNKYPALSHSHICAVVLKEGIYNAARGVGHHELIITRDHVRNLAALPLQQSAEMFGLLQERYRALAKDDCLHYVVSFFNWGATAGASLTHPHMQLLSLPIIPPDVAHSLHGSKKYYKFHQRCAHCDMVKFERKYKNRIVAENSFAIAFAPFASRSPFEVRIFPKRHRPYFERTPAVELKAVTAVLQEVLRRIERHLNDPDLNFFIHTSPLKRQQDYAHYHWHIEILPKISTPAGFEMSTGIEIDVIDPDRAARVLRGGKF